MRRGIGSSCDVPVNQRTCPQWQQILDFRQRPMALDGKVSPRQRGAAGKPPHDFRLEASRRQQRRLHRYRFELIAHAGVGVDKDHAAVGPARLAGYARGHLHCAARERRGKQVKACQAVCLFHRVFLRRRLSIDQISVPP
ncbi:von Willebrand factor domain protein [Mycobacterium xenopi 3993]|nr:von Willebrand factor domain protein [Mycobacterium xenopi 3993]